uniref:Hyaluronan/mRNA-binding protein domain-containing protein n=1 Tax=Noccaea caerulescens TaxID=107243 RepID=A0A1J3K2X0_NOCCA
MATVNPFDLLGNDAEDPSQLAVALPKKVEKAAPVQPAKSGKLPTKQLPSSQAVREAKNAPSGGRGGGGRGSGRGRGGGLNRDSRYSDAPGNENGYSGGFRPSEEGDGGRRGGSVGGYRGGGGGGGRGGGRRGANGESGDVERPRRFHERRSGTGRGNDLKREGGGRANWGTTEDDIPPATEEPSTEVEKSPVAEKQGGEDDTTDAKKDAPVDDQEQKEAEDKEMTLEEYEKILEEKKKALQATKVEERKVDTKVFESMQQLSNKKTTDEEIFIKLGSEKDKRKDASDKEEKVKKALSINEFLKPADGERYNSRAGYRGTGGRGGRGQRDGGVNGRGGRGQRDGGGNRGGNQRSRGAPAPAIEDSAQFPSLGK